MTAKKETAWNRRNKRLDIYLERVGTGVDNFNTYIGMRDLIGKALKALPS